MTVTPQALETETVKTVYDQKLLAFKGDTITRKLHKKGSYDIRTIEFMRQYLEGVNAESPGTGQPRAVYVDIGANIGNHALPVAARCAHMYLFEPISLVADVLQRNLHRNGVKNSSLFRMALSDHARESSIYIRCGNIGASSINPDVMAAKGDALNQREQVAVDTGDHILKAQNPARVDLVKIDVETHEAEVVTGLGQTITRYRPVIVLEWNHPLTAQRFEQLGLFDTLFADYSVATIGDSHRSELWDGKAFGKLRRWTWHLLTRRRLLFGEFERRGLYKNIVLSPREKTTAVLERTGWPIPDRRMPL